MKCRLQKFRSKNQWKSEIAAIHTHHRESHKGCPGAGRTGPGRKEWVRSENRQVETASGHTAGLQLILFADTQILESSRTNNENH